ncbi:hypothetical protein [Streptomyces wuyuanensis]|uniref:Uncharacterized protein n=1 Tax=Streptomyces wuyuanensis TaxID=1196353 RepID=A0A1H0EG44_9ACTN|nr:hypothetical protein [Streptomyces wuyuanensis]SDN81457.1 hypothetical protein SAMN05444921_14411 [Streptomyces wuyuanensis]
MSDPIADVHRAVIAAMTARLIADDNLDDDPLAGELIADLVYGDSELVVPALLGTLTTFIHIVAEERDADPQAVWQAYAELVAHTDAQEALDKEE